VVLKFGGTSVSSVENWRNIARVVQARLTEGLVPVVVHSALSGITDRLEALLGSALDEKLQPTTDSVLRQIEQRHRELAQELGIACPPAVEKNLADLQQIAAGVALVGEVSDRIFARVMATGELLATELGAAFLRSQGLSITWLDARAVLKADERKGASVKASVLSATCRFEPDPELQRRLAALGTVVLTQGFIASDEAGNTVLLGRGGSDTSAAYFAAKLQARRLEIWTDVPGMFTANPRLTPTARLLRSLHYDEAQEIASNGAKVLHPRCILPARQYAIPLYVYATQNPDLPGTVISATPSDGAAQVKAICIKKGITLVSMDSPGMWNQVGFLADAFQIFKEHGLSVDLISTSETSVTVSLDPGANTLDAGIIGRLVEDLKALCGVRVIGPCASLSLLGRNIRGILHKLGDALQVFEEQKIYLVSQAANDLNFTFVIDEAQGDRLVNQLHDLLIPPGGEDKAIGPTWEQLHTPQKRDRAVSPPWWEGKREKLLELGRRHGCAYVYDGDTVDAYARWVKGLHAVDQVFYAIKANAHPELLRRMAAQGLAFECVSLDEVEHVLKTLPSLERRRVLFTPNFAPRAEYEQALKLGVWLTLDNLHPLQHWGELFEQQELFVRIDPGFGRGHHGHVRTAGTHSKFGIPLVEIDELSQLVRDRKAQVVGIHAHTGSGIFNVGNWTETAELLAGLGQRFPSLRYIDIGGGMGVPERPGQPEFNLAALGEALDRVKQKTPPLKLFMEPGRLLVAQAGVLLSQVTQLKRKGNIQYVGVATGMNSLIRPALYGAYHEIWNLTRLEEPATHTVNVVGPICESADQFGQDRLLPETQEGDILLIATAGAYGHAMSSHYNLRPPALEFVI
jgi:diaminopimelate decarboxylase/aspartate kinase